MEYLVDFIYHQPPMVLLIAMQALWVICVVMGLGGVLVRVKDTVPVTSRLLFTLAVLGAGILLMLPDQLYPVGGQPRDILWAWGCVQLFFLIAHPASSIRWVLFLMTIILAYLLGLVKLGYSFLWLVTLLGLGMGIAFGMFPDRIYLTVFKWHIPCKKTVRALLYSLCVFSVVQLYSFAIQNNSMPYYNNMIVGIFAFNCFFLVFPRPDSGGRGKFSTFLIRILIASAYIAILMYIAPMQTLVETFASYTGRVITLGFLFMFVVALFLFMLYFFSQYKQASLVSLKEVTNRVIICVTLGMVSVLWMVNHKVSQYEEVLNTGETLVLELASPLPSEGVRTGSLVLNYQVLTEFLQYKQTHTTEEQRAQLIRDKEDNLKILHQQELYLLLKTDDKGIARFCGVSDSSPSTSSCDRWVRVVQHMQGWQLSGPHHYFIPNGVEMPLSTWVRFLEVRYAQFRQGKDGELLLVQLLDRDLQPIVVENSTFTDSATE